MKISLTALTLALAAVLLSLTACAQEPRVLQKTAKVRGDQAATYFVTDAASFDARAERPVTVLWYRAEGDAAKAPDHATLAPFLAETGRLLAVPAEGSDAADAVLRLESVLRDQRLVTTPEGWRFHLIDRTGFGAQATSGLWGEFRSVTFLAAPRAPFDAARIASKSKTIDLAWSEEFMRSDGGLDLAKALRTAKREGAAIAEPVGSSVPAFIAGARARRLLGPEKERALWAALDDFNDAAAKADAERYFGRFSDDGVFMGTDPDERWTIAEFKTWAAPYFKEAPGWIFVPLDRHVVLDASGSFASFDEVVWSAPYGNCRGTGVLKKVGDAWKVGLYDLTIPVPNDISDEVVRLIDGKAPAEKTIYVVRHAEKGKDEGDGDPALSDAGRDRAAALARTLRSAPLKGIFTSEFKRTRETAATLASELAIGQTSVPAADLSGLISAVKKAPGDLLVVGHSNTVPAILKALGAKDAAAVGDFEYDNLYVVKIVGERTTVSVLHYGAGNPLPMPKRN